MTGPVGTPGPTHYRITVDTDATGVDVSVSATTVREGWQMTVHRGGRITRTALVTEPASAYDIAVACLDVMATELHDTTPTTERTHP